MTIEAMEEGNLGVYEVHVNCHISDGRLALCKFILTNRTPIGGMKGKALSQLRSIYKTVGRLFFNVFLFFFSILVAVFSKDSRFANSLEKDINIYLKTAHKSFKGKKKGVTAAGLICLKKHHFNAMYVGKSRRISQAYDRVVSLSSSVWLEWLLGRTNLEMMLSR
ncbi:hypothetical protein Tco_0671580 [Tanacetum coccineum]